MSKVNETRANPTVGDKQHRNAHHHLSFPGQEERIRQVFGLPPDAALPAVGEQSLEQYCAYLAGRLSLPFEAMYCPNGGEMRQLIHYVPRSATERFQGDPAKQSSRPLLQRREHQADAARPVDGIGRP